MIKKCETCVSSIWIFTSATKTLLHILWVIPKKRMTTAICHLSYSLPLWLGGCDDSLNVGTYAPNLHKFSTKFKRSPFIMVDLKRRFISHLSEKPKRSSRWGEAFNLNRFGLCLPLPLARPLGHALFGCETYNLVDEQHQLIFSIIDISFQWSFNAEESHELCFVFLEKPQWYHWTSRKNQEHLDALRVRLKSAQLKPGRCESNERLIKRIIVRSHVSLWQRANSWCGAE